MYSPFRCRGSRRGCTELHRQPDWDAAAALPRPRLRTCIGAGRCTRHGTVGRSWPIAVREASAARCRPRPPRARRCGCGNRTTASVGVITRPPPASGRLIVVPLELRVTRRGQRIGQHLEVVAQLREVERRVPRKLRAARVLRRLRGKYRLVLIAGSEVAGLAAVGAAPAPAADVEAGAGLVNLCHELRAAVLAALGCARAERLAGQRHYLPPVVAWSFTGRQRAPRKRRCQATRPRQG